ncbi:MAG: acetolactate synthase large subunit [Actinomycetota bacterium]|nr:acetolactate synthase large subunit [Actinomycetota bacterium]
MNGAESLLNGLVDRGVDVCFTNPGTSEMHFVAALDQVPAMRGVLCLFEGVASGAADGYGRIARKPASTLLHLGPGQGNALANFHNARRAKTPIINVIGDHATYHLQYDAPLTSDIKGVAKSFSKFVGTATSSNQIDSMVDQAMKMATSFEKGVSTLIIPADVSWSEVSSSDVEPLEGESWTSIGAEVETIELGHARELLEADAETLLLIGGDVLLSEGIKMIERIKANFSVGVLAETFPSVMDRGGDLLSIDRLAYLGEMATAQLSHAKNIITIGAKEPASFFAYPNSRSLLAPEGSNLFHLASPSEDPLAVLRELIDLLNLPRSSSKNRFERPSIPDGDLTATKVAQTIGALLREGTIVVDEANTSGFSLPSATKGAPVHKWLTLTGGAIGQGVPLATGAGIADMDSRVLCLEADGSSLYTFQALWTQARENLNVTTVIFNNQSYAILELELAKVGALETSKSARRMLELDQPSIDYSQISRAMGVDSIRVSTVEEFVKALNHSFDSEGPFLIEALLPPGIS